MRARNIKPGFFDCEEVGELSMAARILFIGLWCLADSNGYLEYRPKKIKANVFPYDSCNLIKLLEEVSRVNLITIWGIHEDEEVKKGFIPHFIEIPNFRKHQRPHPKEKRSDLKEIVENNDSLIKLHEIKLNYRLILGKRNTDIRNEDIRKREKKKNSSKNKKEKSKSKFGTFNNVLFTEEEYSKLNKIFPGDISLRIDKLSEYIEQSGKKYKNHYATLLSWARKDDDLAQPVDEIIRQYDDNEEWKKKRKERLEKKQMQEGGHVPAFTSDPYKIVQ